MGFEHPRSFAWALLAVVVAALYLWVFVSQRREVATFSLWQRALARRPAWFVLRKWLSLATQLLIVLLLVLALTKPFLPSVTGARRNLVLILDISASMSATDAEPSRFEQTRAEAIRLVDSLRRGESLAIVTAGTTVRPLCRLGTPTEQLRSAIDSLQPTDGETRVADAVAVAKEMLRDLPNANIVILSDGGFLEATAMRDDPDVRLVRIGKELSNVAITALTAREHDSAPGEFMIQIELSNSGQEVVECPLQFEIEGQGQGSIDVEITPGPPVVYPYMITCNETQMLKVTLKVEDDLVADNTASLPLYGSRVPRVLLVAEPSPVAAATQNALKSITGIQLEVSEQLPAEFDPQTIYVFHRVVPNQIPPGRYVVLNPSGSTNLWNLAEAPLKGVNCDVDNTVSDSRLLSGIDLPGIVFEKNAQLEFNVPAEAVAMSVSGDAVLSVLPRPEGNVVVFHPWLDADSSDILLRPDFDQMIRNMVAYLLSKSQPSLTLVTTRETLELKPNRKLIPSDETQQKLQSDYTVEGPLLVLPRVGQWDVVHDSKTKDSGEISSVAVNLLDRAESVSTLPASFESEELPVGEPIWDHPLWMLLLGVAVVLLVLEWCLYHRRVVV